jgi:hypothetical protein
VDIRNDRFNYKGRLIPKYRFKEIDGQEVAIPTKEWQEHCKLLETKRYLLSADIGEVISYGLDTYIGEDRFNNILKLKEYCDGFKTKFSHTHLYLWSKINGTQKSTCAKDIIVRLAKQGVKSKFVLMNNLIKTLLEAERDDKSKEKAGEWSTTEFLVIDECFAKGQVTLFKSGYQLAFLNTFLKNGWRFFGELRALPLMFQSRILDKSGGLVFKVLLIEVSQRQCFLTIP